MKTKFKFFSCPLLSVPQSKSWAVCSITSLNNETLHLSAAEKSACEWWGVPSVFPAGNTNGTDVSIGDPVVFRAKLISEPMQKNCEYFLKSRRSRNPVYLLWDSGTQYKDLPVADLTEPCLQVLHSYAAPMLFPELSVLALIQGNVFQLQ